jgi:hypothetical protein
VQRASSSCGSSQGGFTVSQVLRAWGRRRAAAIPRRAAARWPAP